jgi:hypothetical protein
MHLFDGLGRTDYQDLLRALGRELDLAGARDLRLVETDAGLTLQLRRAAVPGEGFRTVPYPDADLLALLHDAYALRGRGTEDLGQPSALGLPYRRALRAIGRALDQEGLRDLRLIERPSGFLVQASQGGIMRRGFRTHRLDLPALEALIAAMTSGAPADLGPSLT